MHFYVTNAIRYTCMQLYSTWKCHKQVKFILRSTQGIQFSSLGYLPVMYNLQPPGLERAIFKRFTKLVCVYLSKRRGTLSVLRISMISSSVLKFFRNLKLRRLFQFWCLVLFGSFLQLKPHLHAQKYRTARQHFWHRALKPFRHGTTHLHDPN